MDAEEIKVKREESSRCMRITFWCFQIILWIMYVWLIFMLAINNESLIIVSAAFAGSFWLILLILITFSETCAFLSNRSGESNIVPYMYRLFEARPIVKFWAEAYHYSTDSKGRKQKHTTYQETRNFSFQSSKDVSGPFKLDRSSLGRNPEGTLIKLHLTTVVQPSEDGTMDDYRNERDSFFNFVKSKDLCFNSREFIEVKGFREFNLVSVGGYNPWFIGLGYYILFLLLGFPLLYDLYVDCFCAPQEFLVVKEISSKRDLNSKRYTSDFIERCPTIIVNDKVIFDYDDPKTYSHYSKNIEMAPVGALDEVEVQTNQILKIDNQR